MFRDVPQTLGSTTCIQATRLLTLLLSTTLITLLLLLSAHFVHCSTISATIDTFVERVKISQQQQQWTTPPSSWTTAEASITSSNSSIVVLSMRNPSLIQPLSSILREYFNNRTLHMFSFDFESDVVSRASFKASVEMALSMHQIKPLKLIEVSNMLCDCILGNPFVDSNQIEFLITTDKDVPKLIRQIRENSKYAPSRYLELSDFNIVILSPYEIQYVWTNSSFSESFSKSLIQNLKDDMISCLYEMKYCRMNVSSTGISSCYEKHDYCWLRRAQNFFQVAHSELFVNFINQQILTQTHQPAIVEYQFKVQEIALASILEDNNLNSTFSHQLLSTNSSDFMNLTLSQRLDYVMQNEMMNSYQYSCHTSICLFEPLLASEYFQFASILCCLIYYIFLFCMCQKNSIKIRLLLPWCGPLLVMIRILSSSEFIYSTCPVLYSMISIITVTMTIVIYIITILRVLYLRNLYEIISKRNNIGLYKRLASKKFGIFITLLACFLTFLIMLVFIPMFSRIYLTNSLSISRNVIAGCIISLAVLSAIIYSIIDFIFHRKDIKKKGLIYFLFFDDPFYIRIDLICLIFILILLIPFLTPTRISVLSGLFRMLISLTAYMIMGGNTLFIEWVKMLKYRKSEIVKKLETVTPAAGSKSTLSMIKENDHSLEHLLKDSNLFEMLKTYSEKEFSLENILLFEHIQEFVRTQKLTLSQVSQIEENFLKPYSKYEVNISSTTKKAFHEWHEHVKRNQDMIQENSVMDMKEIETLKHILYSDLLNNLNDTFHRMQATEEFMKWEKVVDLQRKHSITR